VERQVPRSVTYVFLAGIGNSEPQHWQSRWYRAIPGSRWVEHADWDHPDGARWVADLDQALQSIEGPKLLVAHSLGCLLAVDWARRHRDPEVRGSFLVSVPDRRGPNFPASAVGFGAAVEGRPPLPALVVASTNDRYSSFEHARAVAAAWQVELVDAGALGHINLESNIGAWSEGRQRLERFVSSLALDAPLPIDS
jgi:predicted alpha/beta hydrolase family esterase